MVDGSMLEVEATVLARVIGGIRVVAGSEPVVKKADVWIGGREFEEFVEVSRSSVVDLVSVCKNDASIKLVQE